MNELVREKLEVVKSSEERIEKIVIADKEFTLLEEVDYYEVGTVVGLKDNAAIRRDYGNDVEFENMETGEEYSIDEVACEILVKDGENGWSMFFGIDGEELMEA
jgi:hypothetical protein